MKNEMLFKPSAAKLIFAFCILVLLLASCAKKKTETDARNEEYIENYISQLKEIEKTTSEKFDILQSLLEEQNENPNDSSLFYIRDAIVASTSANRAAVEEFRMLAQKSKPDFVDDTVQILLRTSTALLAQSYEVRAEAQSWLNRYISLGTQRFFNEYSGKMNEAMQISRQAFSFLTMARVREKVITGDTLDMTLNEFLKIPELPKDTAAPAGSPDTVSEANSFDSSK